MPFFFIPIFKKKTSISNCNFMFPPLCIINETFEVYFSKINSNIFMEDIEAGQSESAVLIPDETKKSLLDLKVDNAEKLDKDVDKICVKSGFQVSKYSGGKNYIYYSCHYGGRIREKTGEKERNKKSKKMSNSFYIVIY